MLVLATMLVLHNVSGVEIDVNPDEITHLRRPEAGSPNFPKSANCMINMSDGKFVTVKETCDQIRTLLETRRDK